MSQDLQKRQQVTSGLLILAFLLFSSCKSHPPDSQPQPTSATNTASQEPPELLKLREPTGLWEYNKALAAAWQAFTKDGRYRFAQPEDFRFSEATKKSLRGGEVTWRRSVTEPYDTWCSGFVAIVVDTTRADNNRFGVIYFPEGYRGKEPTVGKPYWLVRNRDLSSASLTRASCHQWLLVYGEDGTEKSHYLQFNKKMGKYYFPDV